MSKILKSPWNRNSDEIPLIPLHEFFFENVINSLSKHGDSTWITDTTTGNSLKYSEVVSPAKKIASALSKLGFGKGDILCQYSFNTPEYFLPLLAAWTCGGGVTTAPGFLPKEILALQIKDSSPKVIVCDPMTLSNAKEAAKIAGISPTFVTISQIEGHLSLADLLDNDGKECPKDVAINVKEDVVFIPYTSGTTGVPKGVIFTHYNLVSGLMTLKRPASPHQRKLILTSMYHHGGLTMALTGCYSRQDFLFIGRFSEEALFKSIHEYKPIAMATLPAMLISMVKNPLSAKYDLSSLQVVLFGGGIMSAAMESDIKKRLPNLKSAVQGYGMTEIGYISVTSPYSKNEEAICVDTCIELQTDRPGTLGYPLPYIEMKVIDLKTGEDLGPNEDGELCLRGPQLAKGYLNRPDATKSTFVDGWLRTGDLGYYDNEGYIYFKERIKELITYKNHNVIPSVLEFMLLSHPDVQDAAVAGVPDDKDGALPTGFVVIKEGSSTTALELIDFVKGLAALPPLVGIFELRDIESDERKLQTKFINAPTNITITAYPGGSALLPCSVQDLGHKTVSWLKKTNTELYLLTVGRTAYTSDSRYTVDYQYPSEWRLKINEIRISDDGLYVCQIGSDPPLLLLVHLKVSVPAPKIRIFDSKNREEDEIYYTPGSPLELKCLIRSLVIPLHQPAAKLSWTLNGKQLSSFPFNVGLSIQTDPDPKGGTSLLKVKELSQEIGGNYSCNIGSLGSNSVFVHVLESDLPAPMQHGAASRLEKTFFLMLLAFQASLVD
ncbi:uncharacterized protein LOC136026192 isoform X2 [Artemia franciscana]|uniref:uncharacterized protein LOC136026192 isoform X2 n=1 Tax=Artemia franciscana TaxID=6661 RepID=UPI0032DAA38C